MTVVGPSMSTSITEENVNDAMAKILQQGGFGVASENGYTPPAGDAPTTDAATTTDATETETTELPAPDAEPTTVPDGTPTTDTEPFLLLSDGRRLTLEHAERFAEFEQTVMNDPRFLAAYEQVYGSVGHDGAAAGVAGDPPAPAAPKTEATPFELSRELIDELDDNPLAKMMWERLQATQTQAEQLAARYADIDVLTKAHQQAIEDTKRQNAQTLITQAKANFQREHKLSQPDVDRVFNASLSMYNLDRIVALPVNPVTGQMETPDPVRRLEEAFEATYYAIPEFRDREYEAKIQAARTDSERKSKLSSLSSTGSSAPPPAPVDQNNPAAKRDALIADIAAMQSGNMIQPE